MVRKCVDIGNEESFPTLRGGTTDPTAKRNSNTRHLSLKGTEDELTTLEKVESDPVQPGQAVVQNRTHVGGIRQAIALGGEQRRELRVHLTVQGRLVHFQVPRQGRVVSTRLADHASPTRRAATLQNWVLQ